MEFFFDTAKAGVPVVYVDDTMHAEVAGPLTRAQHQLFTHLGVRLPLDH